MRVFMSVALLALVAGTSAPALAAGTLQLSGHGEVQAAPDTAYVTSGVSTVGETARAALDANTKDMTALIDVLKAAGIAPADIQTAGFSVSPNYIYSDARDARGYQLPPKIEGYSVNNGVTVRVRDLAILGEVLDKTVSVGANAVSGISFAVAEPVALYDEARRAALADAKRKAQLYAEGVGATLGPLTELSEQAYGAAQPKMMARREMSMAADAAAVPLEAGQLTFAIDINLRWQLE